MYVRGSVLSEVRFLLRVIASIWPRVIVFVKVND